MSFQTLENKIAKVNIQKICIIKPSAFGDVVQSLSILPALRERFPNAKISWVINTGLASLINDHPLLDEVIHFNRKDTFSGRIKLFKQLRNSQFDLVFDLQGLLRTGIISIATAAPLRVGLKTAREGSHLTHHLTLPDTGKEVSAHRRYWRVAEAIGAGHIQAISYINIPDQDNSWAANLLNDGRKYLAIQAGARWETKRWPVDKFAVIAAKAYRHFGYRPVLVGSPDEKTVSEQFVKLYNKFLPEHPVINLTGETTLKQLSAVLDQSDILLTNDSGPMHLAAALNTPVVGIFTCTSSEKSGPADSCHSFVSTKLSCAASYKKKCPYSGKKNMACHEEIEIDRVWNALSASVQNIQNIKPESEDQPHSSEAA